MCVALTLAAKRRLHRDSAAASAVGATLATISIFASPPRHGCSSQVCRENRQTQGLGVATLLGHVAANRDRDHE